MATAKKAIKPSAKKTIAPKKASTAKPVKVSVPAKPVEQMPKAIFNIDEITELMKAVNHSNVNELKLEKGDIKITIRQGAATVAATHSQAPIMYTQQAAPAPAPVAATAPAAAAPTAPVTESVSDNLITIKSPMIGTFYRSSGPGKPLFVNVGDEIKVGQVLCIVEAMKLFNEIESEVSGRIVKVLADDATPVEYDMPLFLVQPS